MELFPRKMAVKKMKRKLLLLCCFRAKVTAIQEAKKKQYSMQRLLLSDLTDPMSPISSNDLSIVLHGPKLSVFAFEELREVTGNFSSKNYLGEGGFGRVYRGCIGESLRPGLQPQVVAVKALDLDGPQGHMEWLAEVVFLGQIRHCNLVKLIGYCCEDDHRLLVYEFMPLGSLESRLFNRHLAPLTWSTRMRIAVGAAKGLAFLHEEQNSVIFRDFKASNILLDLDYTAKLSDFGLATDGSRDNKPSRTTTVIGTRGYVAPDYLMTGKLTMKSDVYSFGVVLLELLTGRRASGRRYKAKEHSLVEWARPFLKSHKKRKHVMDSRFEGKYPLKAAKKASRLAYRCLNWSPKRRPTMASVVETLEHIIEIGGESPEQRV